MHHNQKILIAVVLSLVWTAGGAFWLGRQSRSAIGGLNTGRILESYEVTAITKSTPVNILYITTSKDNTGESEEVRFFDGNKWLISNTSNKLSVSPSDLNKTISKFSGMWKVGNNTVGIDIPEIQMNLVIKNDINAVKLGGITSREISINGKLFTANIGLFRHVDRDFHEVNLQKIGANTDWLVYWDKNNNFWHADKTTTSIYNQFYSPHIFLTGISSDGQIKSYYLPVVTRYPGNSLVVNPGGNGNSFTFKAGPTFKMDAYYGRESIGGVVSGDDGGTGVFLKIIN